MHASDQIVLVDSRNRGVGFGDKLEVHRRGLLHRAFSIFLVDGEGAVLLQKRHPGKYHSGGLWANSCCGHPRPGEPTMRAARRRLFEELGVRADLTLAFRTRYAASVGDGLTENEIVNVYVGRFAGEARPHPEEIVDLASVSMEGLAREIARDPGAYAYWLRHYLGQHGKTLHSAVARAAALS